MSYAIKLFAFLFLISFQSLFAQKQEISCGVNDSNLSENTIKAMLMTPLWLKQKQVRKAAKEFYVCRIAVDVDSDTYNYFGKDSIYIKHEVLKKIERVSKIYEAEINTQLVVTYLKIWKDAATDPYKISQERSGLLNDVSKLWNLTPYSTFPIDKAMLLSVKSNGGVAYIPGKFSVSSWWDEFIIAHELGHNFGSPHTQNCFWSGGPLDFCVPSEGDCYQEALHSSKGTIMSYCGKTLLTFHPLCQAIMQNHAETSFTKISSIKSPTLPSNGFNFESSRILIFNAVSSAELYEYQVSQSEDFIKDVFTDSTDINAFIYPNFKKNSTYFLRVRAKNRTGISDWSNVISVTVPNLALTAPILKTPSDNTLDLDAAKNISLTFDAVEGANQYELDFNISNDYWNDSYKASLNIATISNTNAFTINPQQIPNNIKCYWRIRAINGNSKSAWSETRRFFSPIGASNIYFTYQDSNNAYSSLFVDSYTGDNQYDTKYIVSLNNDFSKPVFEKTIKPNKYPNSNAGSVFIDKLLPNTQYFLKVESINPTVDLPYNIPVGVIRSGSKSFRTGSESAYSNWQIFNANNNTPNFSKQLYFYNRLGVSAKNLFIPTEEGLIKFQCDSLKSTVFDRDNTKGLLGNQMSREVNIDSVGNVWITVRLSKYNNNTTSDYALRQFDGQTMKLLSSRQIEFEDYKRYINFFDVQNMFVGDGNNIIKLEGNIGKTVASIGYYTDMVGSKNNLWFVNLTGVNGLEIKRYNIQNKGLTILDRTTIPALFGATDIKIKTVSNDNLWVLVNRNFSTTSILKYDGVNWTEYNSNNSPLKYIGDMYVDRFNNVYVNSASSAYNDDVSVLKFNGNTWKEITKIRMSMTYKKIFCDGLGKIWEQVDGSSILRFDPCPQMPKPIISSSLPFIDVNKKTVLEAKGCSNVIWNWKNKEENVYEKFISGTNKIEVSPKSATTYLARCVDEGCSGQEASFPYNFIPVLLTDKVNKTEICSNDTLKISPKVTGNFESNNQFSAILSSTQNTFTFSLVNNKNSYSLPPNSKLLSGKYWLKIEGSSPKVISKDSIEITVLSIPNVNITGANSFCKGQSTNLTSTTKDGTPPYIYQWKQDTTKIGANINSLVVSSLGQYKVLVTDSKGCYITSSVYPVTQNEYPIIALTKTGTDIMQNTSVTLSVPLIAGQTIQWNKDGVTISSATNNTYTVTQAGAYTVSVTANNCTTISEVITINLITNNEPNTLDNVGLKVFPNPNDGNFTVEFNSMDLKPMELIISDILGRSIFRRTIKIIGKYSQQINISDQATGQYFISVQKEDGIKTVKMVKK